MCTGERILVAWWQRGCCLQGSPRHTEPEPLCLSTEPQPLCPWLPSLSSAWPESYWLSHSGQWAVGRLSLKMQTQIQIQIQIKNKRKYKWKPHSASPLTRELLAVTMHWAVGRLSLKIQNSSFAFFKLLHTSNF